MNPDTTTEQGSRACIMDVRLVGGLMLFALVVRLGYFWYAREVSGDAVQFADIARAILQGRGHEIDSSWYQAFCLWQIPFHAMFSDPLWAAGLSSMLPGVVLVGLVFGVSHELYGRRVAILASLFTVLHPNLVHYSCNGYMESFYIFWFTLAVWMLVRLARRATLGSALVAGGAAGIAFATRNEFALFLAALFGMLFVEMVKKARRFFCIEESRALLDASAGRKLGLFALMMLAAMLAIFSLAGISSRLTGSPGVFEKTSNLARTHDIFTQRAAAAQEIYGGDGQHAHPDAAIPGVQEIWGAMVIRLRHNLSHGLPRSLIRLLASPLYVFVAVVLVSVWRREHGRPRFEVIPLVVMVVFPLVFYAFFFVQPRYLQPLLIPLHVFSAVGMVLVVDGIRQTSVRGGGQLVQAAIGGLVVLLVATTVWRAHKARRETVANEQLAAWVDAHVPDGEKLVGCGFGFVSDVGFLSGNPSEPRLVTDDPSVLARNVDAEHSSWLLLSEEFIRESTPELVSVLQDGVPGFSTEYEVIRPDGLRVQALRRVREDAARGP